MLNKKTLCITTCLMLFSIMLTSCTLPYTKPKFLSSNQTSIQSQGLDQLLKEDNEVDVVFVHGMCRHDTDWVQNNIKNISEIYKLVTPKDVDIGKPSTFGKTKLYESSLYLSNGKKIMIYSILWSDETLQAKKTLCYDRQFDTPQDLEKSDGKYCKGLVKDEKLTRAYANNILKSTLLNECLSDALAYAGAASSPIQKDMSDAIASISSENKFPIVVITESLGSKIFYDTLLAMLTKSLRQVNNNKLFDSAVNVRQRIQEVYLEANQIPILSLADPDPSSATSTINVATDSMTMFFSLPKPSSLLIELDKYKIIPVIAFSDPNDIFSYPLNGSSQAEQNQINGNLNLNFIDVITSNTNTWFGLLENPLSAHLEYENNQTVLQVIKCGLGIKQKEVVITCDK